MLTTTSKRGKSKWLLWLFLLPSVLLVLGMYLYPAVQTVLFSFARVDFVSFEIERYVGLDNYIRLLQDSQFQQIIGRTLYFGLMIAFVSLVFSFLIALLLNQPFFGRSIVRTAVLLPWAVPPVVSGVMWGQMFHAESGIINAMLYQLGLTNGNTVWLGNPTSALHIIMMVEIWRAIPFLTLFILAGLQNINNQIYEAASIDGANLWQKFRYFMLPLMFPVLIPLVVIQFSFAMKAFDSIFVLTRGGQNTATLNYFVYRESFQNYDMSTGASAAYILLALTLVVIGVLMLAARRISKGGEAG
ncbi:carbohydrate ABC transporter permease [Paenibacillaceae bacterium WGS1546]|uniref:carbohydrate ABC transporter permease n=1 Tax=Cohnella sp. WGS1546 TaxID=3366810 RepID=UPI00372D07DB